MRRAVRVSIFMLVALLALPFVGFGIYDLAAFQSRRTSIKQKSLAATPDERKQSPMLKKLVLISMHNQTSTFTARLLIQDLKVPSIMHGTLGWHITNALWSKFIELHMSEDEQLTLIIFLSYMGNGHYGYSAEASSRFGRSLSELSLDELATLAAISHAPSMYLSSPERLSDRKEWLIQEFKNGS